jgi:hypothetical protein
MRLLMACVQLLLLTNSTIYLLNLSSRYLPCVLPLVGGLKSQDIRQLFCPPPRTVTHLVSHPFISSLSLSPNERINNFHKSSDISFDPHVG